MRLGVVTAIAVIAGLACSGLGCTTTVNAGPPVDNTSPPPPPAGCTPASLGCQGSSVGWTCAAGDNPEVENPGLSCSVPQADGPNDDFCCFDWTFGTSSCTPDDTITSACTYPSFGYQCAAGDDPTSLDSTLNCSQPTPDGSSDDFCCQ